jgi:hypothetical protein
MVWYRAGNIGRRPDSKAGIEPGRHWGLRLDPSRGSLRRTHRTRGATNRARHALLTAQKPGHGGCGRPDRPALRPHRSSRAVPPSHQSALCPPEHRQPMQSRQEQQPVRRPGDTTRHKEKLAPGPFCAPGSRRLPVKDGPSDHAAACNRRTGSMDVHRRTCGRARRIADRTGRYRRTTALSR